VALLLWMSAPALACLVPGEKLSAAEMECCHEMKGDCGGMAMEQHSCCPPVPAKVQTDKKVLAIVDRYVSAAPVAHSVAVILLVPLVAQRSSLQLVSPSESPPGAPLSLRI
jgi:hypothetical protein